MAYPFGVPTPIEIVTTSRNLFKLYEEARERQTKVNAANELLSSIGSTIDRLEQAGGGEPADNSSSALTQVRTARTAWKALHEHLQKFQADEQSQRSLNSRARSVRDDVRWAFNVLDGKVSELKQEISLSLLAIMPTQIADLQGSMALLTAEMSELRSAPMLQTAPDKSLIVRAPFDHNFSSDLSDVRSVVPLTFVELAELRHEYGMALEQRLASFKLLFSSGKASHTDVRPDGDGYLDLILREPWPLRGRKAQWDLVKFLIVGAPESVLRNPRLLHHCAKWIGEGPHMDMLATLLSFGLDPEHFDSSLFIAWPRSCDPGWLAEDLAPDPMFIDFLRACLQRQPGFAGCDDLTEAVLTGEDSEFESALCRAKAEGGFLRMLPNALGQTATHLAITSPRRLERLLRSGADPDCVDRGGLTPLMYAAAYGKQQSVLHLFGHQATWHLQERLYGRIFLDYAICRRNLHVIESLVDWLREAGDHGTASEVLDHCIAKCIVQYNDHYDISIPHRLFELGADVDTIVNRSGFASPNIRDDSGKTPFMQVAHLVDSKTLITFASEEQGAEFNAQDAKGKTALHHLLGSSYVEGIYDNCRTDKSLQLKRHRNMISCLNTLIQHGVSAARHQNDSDDVSKWSSAIRRYHAFEERGARAEQIQAMANFDTKSSGSVCTDDDIISSLAALCLLYEQQSIAKHGSIVARREPKLHVDYNKDEIKYRFGFEFAPPIREVTIDCYKDWLRWCDRNFVKLDIKGGRRSYTEYGWRLVSMFEDKVDELRSGTETWYTAPEQPAETP
ncbi:hypothetical protein D0867_00421 [Hortaea werneckii]|uniref:Uncharacterized protein n=1 Tax=Hortaea werneckii TaxID=91943 RepID=A0A3M7AEN6_HORWE|nr:hypothetical protein D0867_00421 [Hortaea werneckii]